MFADSAILLFFFYLNSILLRFDLTFILSIINQTNQNQNKRLSFERQFILCISTNYSVKVSISIRDKIYLYNPTLRLYVPFISFVKQLNNLTFNRSLNLFDLALILFYYYLYQYRMLKLFLQMLNLLIKILIKKKIKRC